MTETFTARIATDGDKQDVFESITDYRSIDSYTEGVRVAGRGSGVGTRVYFNLKQNILDIPTRYTVKLEFTDYEEPEYIEWEVIEDIDAHGTIRLEDSDSRNTDICVDFSFDRSNSNLGALPLPNTQGMQEIFELIFSRIYGPVTDIVKGIISDIEGDTRELKIEFSDVSEELKPFIEDRADN